MSNRTILVTAYAINPYKGSEEGTGWNWVCQIAQNNRVIAISRQNNQEAIDRYLQEQQPAWQHQVTFLYFDLPYWLRFWKGSGLSALLYHYLWHLAVVAYILHKRLSYDMAHHLNFHADWSPSFLWMLGKPWVWGPIGHHPPVPKAMIVPVYGHKAWLSDRLRTLAKQVWRRADPFMYLAHWQADHILCMHQPAMHQLAASTQLRASLMPAIGSEAVEQGVKAKGIFQVLSIGRFVPLKGFDITIRSFARFYHKLPAVAQAEARLVLVGKGPCKPALEAIARAEGIASAISWANWMDRTALQSLYQQSSVFLFPSHEGAGMVVPEAMAHGLPVVCYDNCGPGELSGEAALQVACQQPEQCITDFANCLKQLYTNPELYRNLQLKGLERHRQQLLWEVKGRQINQIYDTVAAHWLRTRRQMGLAIHPNTTAV